MVKPCYYEYVAHMVRFFLTTPEQIQVREHTKADLRNWLAVDRIWSVLDDTNREIIKTMCAAKKDDKENLRDRVLDLTKRVRKTEGEIWLLYRQITHEIAKVRGLI